MLQLYRLRSGEVEAVITDRTTLGTGLARLRHPVQKIGLTTHPYIRNVMIGQDDGRGAQDNN